MRPLPIRAKFAVWAGLAIALALGASATGTLFVAYQRQLAESDDDIASETKEVKVQLQQTGKPAEQVPWDLDPHMGWMVFDDAGHVLRTDPIITEAAARPALTHSGIISTGSRWTGWRVSAFRAAPDRTIVVGYSMVKVNDVIIELILAYAWSLPLVVIVIVAVTWWVTGRALAPFRDLAATIEGIQSENLERRVIEPEARDEIQRLAASFNSMLARLARSFSQTKRFAADASHELRTPLTIMRSEVELAIRHPELPPALLPTLVSVQDEIARLDRITEQLMLLARFDAGQIVLKKTPIEYSALVTQACDDAELLASAAEVALEAQIEPDVHLTADPNHLRRLLLNLLDNACKYNRPQGRVRCTLMKDNEHAVLRIANNGPGIPAEMRTRVFERFFRADPSRPNTRGHGLGLALCWEIVELHGGKLALAETTDPDWTEFEVRLPNSG